MASIYRFAGCRRTVAALAFVVPLFTLQLASGAYVSSMPRQVRVSTFGRMVATTREGKIGGPTSKAGTSRQEQPEAVVAAANVDDKHLEALEAAIQPLFAATPKNAHGRLAPAPARLVLHRFFVQRHSWFLHGLDPNEDLEHSTVAALNDSSPTEPLRGRVTKSLLNLFEGELHTRGLSLHELAALAATIERVIREELVVDVRAAFTMHRLSHDANLNTSDADEVMITHLAALFMNTNLTGGDHRAPMRLARVTELRKQVAKEYPGWPMVCKLAREALRERLGSRVGLPLDEVVAVLEVAMARFMQWQGREECGAVKRTMLTAEESGTGCVLLADFYGKLALQGNWQFSENPAYLRSLGALEESDPENPRVIIPNYIQGANNCVASTTFYTLCCRNECEDLLTGLEGAIQAPDATPAEVVAAVRKLPSVTVPAGRTLPAPLLAHLDALAKHHGGRVPFRDHHFAEWMHFAYPRECPYPRPHNVSGHDEMHTEFVWAGVAETRPMAKEQMMQEVRKWKHPGRVPGARLGACTPMTQEEELATTANTSGHAAVDISSAVPLLLAEETGMRRVASSAPLALAGLLAAAALSSLALRSLRVAWVGLGEARGLKGADIRI